MNTKTPSTLRILQFVLLALATMLVVACGGQKETPPTPTVVVPTTAPTRAPDVSGAWERIKREGKMIVGTSADYAPFAYYTNDFQMDGLDVAIIRAVGKKLGVNVQINDMAFDGLGGALQINQIDAAIGAISVTNERREQLDFSNVYLISEDAVLARASDPIVLNSIKDAAGRRIGVQSGSSYQQWIVEQLVEPGLLPANNVFLYRTTDQAVQDLANNYIDLVVGDAPAMQTAVETGRFKIAAQGLNSQQYAIALPKGSTLTPEINRALLELQRDGTLTDLVEKYLKVDIEDVVPVPTVMPTATPLPAATATPVPAPTATPSACVDAMKFVGDLNYDDKNMTAPPVMSPGQAFQKGWRIQNTGTCTWDGRYMMVFTSGNTPQASMAGYPTPVQGIVPPGGVYDMYVNLVAPVTPGTFQGFWTLRNSQGLLFGDRVWVGITVPAPATPTPPPTATPSATINFTVDRTLVNAGECVNFSWDVKNAIGVYFYALGQPFSQNERPFTYQQRECPGVTTTYELKVIKRDDTTENRQIRIDVQQPPVNAPVIEYLNLNPSYQIQAGQCVDVTWKVAGDANYIRLTRDSAVLWDGAPLSGTSRDCPPVGQVAYVLEVSGPGGNARAQNNLSVVAPPTPAPQVTPTAVPPTPTPPLLPPPVVNAFAVTPTQIMVNQCVSINWSVGGTVDRIQLKRDGLTILDNAPLNGNASDCLGGAGTYTYRLEATNAAGQVSFQQASVVVGSPEPPVGNPLQGTSWRLERINGAAVLSGTELSAEFGDGANLSGSGGCNTYTGAYRVTGSSLSISDLIFGRGYCPFPDGIMEQEASFANILGSASGFTIDEGRLIIRGTQGQLEFGNLIGPRSR